MTVASLGSISVNNASTTVATTCAAPVAAGTPVIVFVYDANNAITGNTVTDTAGNTYTLADSSSPTANFFVAAFYSFISTPLTTSDVVTYHCGNRFCTKTLSVVSALGYGAIDPATTNSAINFSTTYSVTAAGAAAVANELYFGFVVTAAATVNAASGWATNPPVAPTANFYPAYKVNTGTAALTFNGTVGSQWWAALIVSLQPNLTVNFASFAITETHDIAAMPINDSNQMALSVLEARDRPHFVFFNLAQLNAVEGRDRVVIRSPQAAPELSTVRVSLTGRKPSPDLEGNL
jgi:hypothetical protein